MFRLIAATAQKVINYGRIRFDRI